MEAHEERVIEEKKELDIKITKLDAFCHNADNVTYKSLAIKDQDLLEQQFTIMQQYSLILGQRIARFNSAAAENRRGY